MVTSAELSACEMTSQLSPRSNPTSAPSQTTLDLDQILTSWAADKLGAGVVNRIDASDVLIKQLSVIYKSNQDWFKHRKSHEEIFDNSGTNASTWNYEENVTFPSNASWTILRGYKSSVLPLLKLHIEYPIAEESHQPLKGVFEKPNAGTTVEATGESRWKVNSTVNVKPFTSTKASAEVKTCRLNDVPFTTDIQMSGRLKISGTSGSKRNSKPGKHVEIVGTIEEALGSRPEFTIVDSSPTDEVNNEAYNNTKQVCFRIEGRCTGEVGIEAKVKLDEVQSLV